MSLDSQAAIRKSFSRAAPLYARAANHQKQVAEKLVSMMLDNKQTQATLFDNKQQAIQILDLGCGTGFVAEALEQKVNAQTILQIDIAEAMLKQNRAKTHLLCADMQALPLKSESMSLCSSSYALQWASHLPVCMQEIYRVLKPGGQLCFSIPAPGTFHEIKHAWQQVDNSVHVHEFFSKEAIAQAAQQSGFQMIDFFQKEDVLYYLSIQAALQHIKNIGAHNLDSERNKSLMGKSRYQKFCKAYERLSVTNASCPLTYHSYFFVMYKPVKN